jgi:hypothetical protein
MAGVIKLFGDYKNIIKPVRVVAGHLFPSHYYMAILTIGDGASIKPVDRTPVLNLLYIFDKQFTCQ